MQKTITARIRAAASGLILAGLMSASALAQAAPVVQTRSGPVQATVRGDMLSYFAIPFAAPPVGDLRWRA
ncbi:MAG: carboxylesterase family protein, partial [Phenylobacterium sp.]|nr:carboxylesterase family protein [Phenylobacterium sp.]